MKKEVIALPADGNDPEDRAVSEKALERGLRSRFVRTTRTKTGLSQEQFSKRYHIPLGTLRDWEQGRTTAPDYAIAYMRTIRHSPEIVGQAVA